MKCFISNLTLNIFILFNLSCCIIGSKIPMRRNIFDDIAHAAEDVFVDPVLDTGEAIVDQVEDTTDSLVDAGVPCKVNVINSSGKKIRFDFFDADDVAYKFASKTVKLSDGETGKGKCSKGVFDHKYCELLFYYYYTNEDGHNIEEMCETGALKAIAYIDSYELVCDKTYNFTGECSFSRVD